MARKLYNVIGRSAAGNAAVKAAPNRMPLHPATVFQPPRAATIVENLRQYRESEKRRRGVPAYTIFKDETIDLIATQRPTDLRQLGNIRGVGQSTLQQHGDIIIKIVRGTADYTECRDLQLAVLKSRGGYETRSCAIIKHKNQSAPARARNSSHRAASPADSPRVYLATMRCWTTGPAS